MVGIGSGNGANVEEVRKVMGEQQVRGMKVRSSVKKLCEGCKVCVSLVSFNFLSAPCVRRRI